MNLYRAAALTGALALAFGAAADDATVLAERSGIRIEDGVVVATGPRAPAGAVFLTIVNEGGDDTLLGVASDAAARAELHDTEVADGIAKMRPVASVPIPADATVVLAGGGLHVMLMGLTAPLTDGGAVPLTLRFEHAGTIPLEVPVALKRPATGAGAMPGMSH